MRQDFGRLPRKVVSRARNVPAFHEGEEFTSMLVRHLGNNAVRLAVQDDRRYRNRWLRGQRLFQLFILRVAGRVSVSMAVRMDRDLDEVRIIPRGRGLFEHAVGELPMR